MATIAKKRPAKGTKNRFIGKPNGHIQERVRSVGPEHFGDRRSELATLPVDENYLSMQLLARHRRNLVKLLSGRRAKCPRACQKANPPMTVLFALRCRLRRPAFSQPRGNGMTRCLLSRKASSLMYGSKSEAKLFDVKNVYSTSDTVHG